MAISYSLHLSNKGNAVSSTGKISSVSKHNLRLYKSDSYDKNQIEVLAGSDNSILDDVKAIYHAEFDEALERYNDGKRADRQIHDYLEHVSNSRSDVACELIIQVGDQDFWKNKTQEQRKQMSYIFNDQLRALQKLVPELKVASAVIHYDEKSPHMHVVGVPVAEGYKKGMEKQCAKTKVFTPERLSYLQEKMREYAERGMELNPNLFGEERLKEKEAGRNKDIPKASLDEFYALKKSNQELQGQIKVQNETLAANHQAFQKQLNTYAQNEQTLISQNASISSKNAQIEDLTQKGTELQEELKKLQYDRNTLSELNILSKQLAKSDPPDMEKHRKGTLILGADIEDVDRVYRTATVLDGAVKVAQRHLEKARDTIQEAKKITQDKSKIIEAANTEASEIVQNAQKQAENLKRDNDLLERKYNALKKDYNTAEAGLLELMDKTADEQANQKAYDELLGKLKAAETKLSELDGQIATTADYAVKSKEFTSKFSELVIDDIMQQASQQLIKHLEKEGYIDAKTAMSANFEINIERGKIFRELRTKIKDNLAKQPSTIAKEAIHRARTHDEYSR